MKTSRRKSRLGQLALVALAVLAPALLVAACGQLVDVPPLRDLSVVPDMSVIDLATPADLSAADLAAVPPG